MFQALFYLFAAFPVLAFEIPGQIPLTGTLEYDDLAKWDLNVPPNPNATDHLIFETVYSLLQHWPNTRMRNGHNIVPGVISKGTLLYHGTGSRELPPGPEWVATDPEHSYAFCRERPRQYQSGCWQLTLAVTRPLRIVYFDGSSAAKIPYGTMDTQDLLAWGKTGSDSDAMYGEMQRIRDLCDWGGNFGVDGFIRMEMDFEVMLCDFTEGVSVVSFLHLTGHSPFNSGSFTSFETMNAGSWHNRFPGETRVHLDLAQLISFYDTQIAPSLVEIRAGQERWDHRAQNVSDEDMSIIKSRLEASLANHGDMSSGIDWQNLFQVILDRFGERLEFTRHLLNLSTTEPDEILDIAIKAQTQLRIMLTPYLLVSATPPDPSDKVNLQWTSPIYKLCATTHTNPMKSELNSMTDSEKLLLLAARGTTREICRVITRMWAAGVYAGVDQSLNTKQSPDISEVTHLWDDWKEQLTELMDWLDWSVWIKCSPGCAPEELCWLPTWPVGFPRSRPPKSPDPDFPHPDPGYPPRPDPESLTNSDLRTMALESLAEEMQNAFGVGPDDWIRPQPRCISRVYPYNM